MDLRSGPNAWRDDPQAGIDNNLAENAIRPIALGRKNWLFIGTELAQLLPPEWKRAQEAALLKPKQP